MIVEDLIVRINNFRVNNRTPKALKVTRDEFDELMQWAVNTRGSVLGDSGFDAEKGCFVFHGFEVRVAA